MRATTRLDARGDGRADVQCAEQDGGGDGEVEWAAYEPCCELDHGMISAPSVEDLQDAADEARQR